jgi:hypothetical protein
MRSTFRSAVSPLDWIRIRYTGWNDTALPVSTIPYYVVCACGPHPIEQGADELSLHTEDHHPNRRVAGELKPDGGVPGEWVRCSRLQPHARSLTVLGHRCRIEDGQDRRIGIRHSPTVVVIFTGVAVIDCRVEQDLLDLVDLQVRVDRSHECDHARDVRSGQ